MINFATQRSEAYTLAAMTADEPRLILTLSCPDQVGLVAAVSGFIAEVGGWIVESSNYADRESQRFFMREEILVSSLSVEVDEFRRRFGSIGERFNMQWKVTTTDVCKQIGLFVSKEEHCLYDLLSRQRAGELHGDIRVVIANHPDLEDVVRWHGIDFHHVPIHAETHERDFAKVKELLTQYNLDVIVLARYMQVLPDDLCSEYAARIINIHHSFLPSFKGARPYHQAHERGVKLIGATCHYATSALDEGPIIEQDVIRIDHGDSVASLRNAGKDIEKAVLARGLRWHLEDRVFINGQRTVVFR